MKSLSQELQKKMVQLILPKEGKVVYIATESPVLSGGNFLKFAITNNAGYRSVSKESVILPQGKTVVIGFGDVYGNSFNCGNRSLK